jgi:hypothetical protein
MDVRCAVGSLLLKEDTPRNHKRIEKHDECERNCNTPVNFLPRVDVSQPWQDVENQPDRFINNLHKKDWRKTNGMKHPCNRAHKNACPKGSCDCSPPGTLRKVSSGNWQQSRKRSERHRNENRDVCKIWNHEKVHCVIPSRSCGDSNPSPLAPWVDSIFIAASCSPSSSPKRWCLPKRGPGATRRSVRRSAARPPLSPTRSDPLCGSVVRVGARHPVPQSN